MPIDKEKIKDALDSFENDDFVTAKETLSKEIGAKRDEFLKDKLNLRGDSAPEPKVDDNDKDTGEE